MFYHNHKKGVVQHEFVFTERRILCMLRKSLLFDMFDRWHLWYNSKPLQFQLKHEGECLGKYVLNVERKVGWKLLFYFVP